MPGAAMGRVTSRNVRHELAPRSAEASSSCRFIPASRARTMKVTTAMENIAWEMMSRNRRSEERRVGKESKTSRTGVKLVKKDAEMRDVTTGATNKQTRD